MISAKTFEEFKEILKCYETETSSRFNVYQNPKGFLDEKPEISANMKLHWKDGLPYYHFGTRIYTCHLGKDKNVVKKRRYAENREKKAWSENSFPRVNFLANPTKKLNCPVSMTVTRVWTLPHLKLKDPKKWVKKTISTKLKLRIKNNEVIGGEEAFWFTLPSIDAHNHHTQAVISTSAKTVNSVHSKRKKCVDKEEKNPLLGCDNELLDINYIQTDSDSANLDHNYNEVMSEENNEDNQDGILDEKLNKRENKRRKLINDCNSDIRNLSSILPMLPESALLELKKDLAELTEKMQNIHKDDSTLPIAQVKETKANIGTTKDSINKQCEKHKISAKRKLARRTDMQTNAMKQTCKPTVSGDKTEIINVIYYENFDLMTNTISPIVYDSTL